MSLRQTGLFQPYFETRSRVAGVIFCKKATSTGSPFRMGWVADKVIFRTYRYYDIQASLMMIRSTQDATPSASTAQAKCVPGSLEWQQQ